MKNPKTDKNISKKSKSPSKAKKIILVLAICFVILPALALGVAVISFAIYANSIEVDASLLPTAKAVPTFYDRFGNKLSYSEDEFITVEEIPDNLKYAFISTEDKRFYSHKGYDIIRIGGAILSDIKAGKVVEGASTITQQLAKNTHLSNERTFKRKLNEIALATKLEKSYSKDEILSMYLSVIYFGNGLYGAKQAAKYYFSKDIEDLSVSESATLAAIVKNPSKYSPNKNPQASLSRRNLVIDKMYEQNFIALDAANIEKSKPLDYVEHENASNSHLSDDDLKIYFDNAVQEVCEVLGITKYKLFNSGYKIYTNYDKNIQKIAVENLKDTTFSSDNSKCIIVENNCGEILAYASTLGYNPKRQIGSTIKPILYSAALDTGILTLATPVVDEKISYGEYSPRNFNDIYYGNTLIIDAIKKSMNTVAVKTCDYLGIDTYFDYAKRFGLSLDINDKNYSLALGATEKGISPIEIISAYTVFPNDGRYNPPHFVKFILDGKEKIYSSESNQAVQIIKPSTAQLMTVALKETAVSGTAKSLSVLPFEIAAKTGTSERPDGKNSDAWCVSYTNEYTLLVWHGSDDGMKETGGGAPTKQSQNVWLKIQELSNDSKIYKNLYDLSFSTNEIEKCDIDLYSTFSKKKTISASENTALEYRKSMYFESNRLPNSIDSLFENIEEPNFAISKVGRKIEISFESLPIYHYELFRIDMFGTHKVYEFSQKAQGFDTYDEICASNETHKIIDYPFSFVGVSYRLVAHLKNNENIKNMSTKTVFVDNIFS